MTRSILFGFAFAALMSGAGIVRAEPAVLADTVAHADAAAGAVSADDGIYAASAGLPADEAFRIIAGFSGENLVVFGSAEKPISFAFQGTPAEQALQKIAADNKFFVVRGDKIVMIADTKHRKAAERLAARRYGGRLISLHVDHRPLQAVIGVIAQLAQEKIVVSKKIECPLTLDLAELPADLIVGIAALRCGLSVNTLGGTISLQEQK